MDYKKMNNWERLGVIQSLNEVFEEIDLNNLTCGSTDNNLVNIQNTYVNTPFFENWPKLGSFGLSQGEDIVLRFWDQQEINSKDFWISYSGLKHSFYPMKELKAYKK